MTENVSSNAKTVDEYIDTLKGERKEAIQKLRELFIKTFSEAEESMQYKMPTYRLGVKVFAFASQKHYISLYIYPQDLIKKYKQALGNVHFGKHSIRFKGILNMHFDVIQQLLEDAST